MNDKALIHIIHAAMEGDPLAANQINDLFEENKLKRLKFPIKKHPARPSIRDLIMEHLKNQEGVTKEQIIDYLKEQEKKVE